MNEVSAPEDGEWAPLTFGQMSVWRDIDSLPESRWHEANWVFTVPVPQAADTTGVRAAVAKLAERHAALRTVFDVSDPARPAQRVQRPDEGEAEFEVVRLPASNDLAPVLQALAERPFDLRTDRCYRALLIEHGYERTLAISKHHLAVDAWSVELLVAELSAILSGNEVALLPGSESLSALAREQQSQAWAPRAAGTERHFRRTLSAPAARFADLSADAQVCHGQYESARLYKAAEEIVHRCNVSLSTVILAAYVRAVSAHCSHEPVRVGLMASNRFGERWAELVTSMNQLVPIMLEQNANPFERSALNATQNQTLRAYRLAMYDVDAMRPDALGLPADLDASPTCTYNLVTPWHSTGLMELQDGVEPEVSWEETDNQIGPRCYLRVCETTSHTLLVVLRTKNLGRQVSSAILKDLYRAVVAGPHP